jgi:cation/acetate symporter
VAQYIVLLLAFLIPVSWLAYKQLGQPAAPLVYGTQLQKISVLEDKFANDPREQEVAAIFLRRARDYEARLHDVAGALAQERAAAQQRIRELKLQGADSAQVYAANRAFAALPRDVASAREQWTRAMNESYERAKPLGGLPRHSQPFAGDPEGSPQEREAFDVSRRNFLALMFCLMVGTAGLPHLLTRYYTTPSVAATRSSVAWSLFFIALVYVSAPALAALVKFEVMNNLVGSSFDALPPWIAQWAKVDPVLISVADVNGDRILQWGEIHLGADIIMLATPELGGLPYVISGLVAAGGLAAALSTADGLLLTISNALVRDIFCHDIRPQLKPEQRVILSKFALMAVALVAAVVATTKPAEILPLVSASFSLAASAFVPAMLLGILWRGANRKGATAGMLAGLGLTIFYMMANAPGLRAAVGLPPGQQLWFGIQPLSAAVFGVPAGLLVTWLVSVLTRGSSQASS